MLFTVENGHQRPDHIIEPLLIIKRKTSLSHFEQYPFEHGRSNDRIARRGFLGNTVKYALGLSMGRVDTYIYQRHDSSRAILLQPVDSLETANESQGGRNRSISCHGALRGLRFHFPPNGLKPPASSRSASAAHARLHHRFHVEWVTKYREKVLQGPMRERIGEII